LRQILFDPEAFEDYQQWIRENPKLAFRIGDLILEITKTPFTGKGKPEPLKHEYKGCWSRRITDEHRLIYKVTDSHIFILACRHHY
jgi:toxin YoeB